MYINFNYSILFSYPKQNVYICPFLTVKSRDIFEIVLFVKGQHCFLPVFEVLEENLSITQLQDFRFRRRRLHEPGRA